MKLQLTLGSMTIEAERSSHTTRGADPTHVVKWKGRVYGKEFELSEFQGTLTGKFNDEKIDPVDLSAPNRHQYDVCHFWEMLDSIDHVRQLIEPEPPFYRDPYYGGE